MKIIGYSEPGVAKRASVVSIDTETDFKASPTKTFITLDDGRRLEIGADAYQEIQKIVEQNVPASFDDLEIKIKPPQVFWHPKRNHSESRNATIHKSKNGFSIVEFEDGSILSLNQSDKVEFFNSLQSHFEQFPNDTLLDKLDVRILREAGEHPFQYKTYFMFKANQSGEELSTPCEADGYVEWRLPNGTLHRDHGPAKYRQDGAFYAWYQNGELHRDYGPAYISTVSKQWHKLGKLHREDGPAIEYADGEKHWYLNGKRHREDGPAIESSREANCWYLNNNYHREDGPAIEWTDGSKEWWINGKPHREDGPAVEYTGGEKHWYLNGEELSEEDWKKKVNTPIKKEYSNHVEWRLPNGSLHREDGPAIEWTDGTKHWYLNGKLHRKDGPAIEYADGHKCWYLNGNRHREDGPAIEYANGKKYWYLNEKELSEEEWKEKVKWFQEKKQFDKPDRDRYSSEESGATPKVLLI